MRLLRFSSQWGALLTLASSEAGDEREPVDLAAIANAALAGVRPAIRRLGLRVQTRILCADLDGDPLLVSS